MKFDIITIFSDILNSYINESILGRAQNKKLIKIKTHDLRKWTIDKHRSVDDKPYGGGPGMLFKVEPIYKAIKSLKPAGKTKVILLSAKGKTFNQKIARQLAKQDRLLFICGRYEGVDERVAKHIADMEISIGDFVLAGGELPAIIITEAVARLIPGVLGKAESLKEESFSMPEVRLRSSTSSELRRDAQFSGQIKDLDKIVEYAQYTRPEVFNPDKKKKWRVPKVLLSGNHKKIKEWRNKNI